MTHLKLRIKMQAASDSLKKFEKSYKTTAYPVASSLGFTWLPEIVLKGKINNLTSVIGSGVWLFGFLISGQLFGFKGITLHSMVYGGGMTVASLFTLMD